MTCIIHNKNFGIWSKLALLIWKIHNLWNIDKMWLEVFHFSLFICRLSCIGCNYLYPLFICCLSCIGCNYLYPSTNVILSNLNAIVYVQKHLILANTAALFQVTLSAKEMGKIFFPFRMLFHFPSSPCLHFLPLFIFYRVRILWGIEYFGCRSWWLRLGRNWGWQFHSDTVCLWTI